MTATLTTEYRAIAATETAANDPLSVRFVRTSSRNLNNHKTYVAAPRLIHEIGFPADKWISKDNSIDEVVIHQFVKRPIPDGYNMHKVRLTGIETAGGGATYKTTWKLYATTRQYVGPAIFDAAYLSAPYGSASLVVDSNADYVTDVDRAMATYRDSNGDCWYLLTAANGNTGVRGKLIELSVVLSEA